MDLLMDNLLLEQLVIYGSIFIVCALIIFLYLWKKNKDTTINIEKVATAKEEGIHEPVSLHPFIDPNSCIGSGACVSACPEQDILGIVSGKAVVINASNCVGHGACFHACPVEAISLRIGTEKRGVDLPHVNQNFETNMKGIYIAGELGGMGLIKNSVEQGQQAIESIVKSKRIKREHTLDIVIVGAGPAGIAASLAAKKYKLNSVTLEQESLGGTVYTFPRQKVVMTSPMEIPLYGKVKLHNTSKEELLEFWKKVINEHDLPIQERCKVESILPKNDGTFEITTNTEETFITLNVLLAIGRRGSPRKLGVPGENLSKVAYRLLEPELIHDKKIMVVGGGDSAIETVLLLKEHNQVVLSYRKNVFSRLKPKNREAILDAEKKGDIIIQYESEIVAIHKNDVLLRYKSGNTDQLENDLVFIFAGGELPTSFLEKAGVQITKRFGYILKEH
jgi:thioredoxin reductase (NADPH)